MIKSAVIEATRSRKKISKKKRHNKAMNDTGILKKSAWPSKNEAKPLTNLKYESLPIVEL